MIRQLRAWADRASTLRAELAELDDLDDLDVRWWGLAAIAAVLETLPGDARYVIHDAQPASDTFLAIRAPSPLDPFAYAVARAHAARSVLRSLHGTLPEQPLAVTVATSPIARVVSDPMAVVAFAIGDRVVRARLADRVEDESALVAALASGDRHDRGAPRVDHGDDHGGVPFVGVTIGEEALSTARHAHRRAWRDGRGPWLGLGRADGFDVVSTCHLVVDGHGHALVAGEIARATREFLARTPTAPPLTTRPEGAGPSPGAVPLAIAWRELDLQAPSTRALAYALGVVLRARLEPNATRSPTFQIPIARGASDDPQRRLRRLGYATLSVRARDGVPEAFDEFGERMRATVRREAEGCGLNARLLAALAAAPVPLRWKRGSLSAHRPPGLDRLAEVLAGRAFLSRIRVDDRRLGGACLAASSPPRIESVSDPIGGCGLTLVEDGERATLTLCGSGFAGSRSAAEAWLDEILATAAALPSGAGPA